MKKKSTWSRILFHTKEQIPFHLIRILLTVFIVLLENFIVILNSYAIDNYIIAGNKSGRGKFSIVLILAVLGLYLFSILWHYLAILIGGRSVISLQRISFRKLYQLPPAYFDKESSGDLLARLRNDISVIDDTFFFPLNDLIVGIVGSIISFIFLFSIDYRAGLLASVLAPIIVLIVFLFIKKKVKLSEKMRSAVSGYIEILNERISSVQTVKALLLEQESIEEFKSKSDAALNAETQKAYSNAFSTFLVNLVVIAGTITILYTFGMSVSDSRFSVGNITSIITIFTNLSVNLSLIISSISTFKENAVAGDRILKIIEEVPSIIDSDAVIQKYGDYEHPRKENWENIDGRIEFKHVFFEYKKGNPILKDFCLTIQKGEKLAIVGATGAGKTTIINLIARFYEAQSGEILIDDRNIKERSQLWIQSNLGYVLQNPMLFSGSILYNLKYGNEDISDEEVIQKSKECSLDELVWCHSEGYQTDIEELSAGERQLVSIVRTVISNPKIVLMDEATSSIDTLTDRNIQNAMDKLIENKTSIIVAHRLSTIINADRIIVIENGTIVEEGTHIILMQRQGAYYKYYMAALEKEMYSKIVE